MEDIIVAIVLIGIIISSILKFINKVSSEGNIEKSNPQNTKNNERYPGQNYQKEDEGVWIPAYEAKPKETQADDRNSVGAPPIESNSNNFKSYVAERENKVNRTIYEGDTLVVDGKKIYSRGSKDNRKRINNKKKRNSSLESRFSDDDLIKGIIFREILNEPRARNPYKPINKK